MKESLLYINGRESIIGNVLEHDSSGYILKRYSNDYGKPFCEILSTLTQSQTADVIAQDNLAGRIKKLYSFFNEKPEFISDEVIYLLNLDKEDIFSALAGIVKFPY